MSGQPEIPKLPTEFVAGDQRPDLAMVLQGTDLTDHTVELRIARPDGTTLVKAATPVTYATKQSSFKFTWDASDLQAGCDQQCEVKITTPPGDGSKPLTSRRFLIDVRAPVGS